MPPLPAVATAAETRQACRGSKFCGPTAGLAKGQIQANLLVLPGAYAEDFERLCRRNPVPCPLLGKTAVGDPRIPSHLAQDADIRTDLPLYNVYHGGKLKEQLRDITHLWQADSVAFLIGCSFSFETALSEAGLPPRHVEISCNVPMYRTTVPLAASGHFGGSMIVSMRPYRPEDVERVRAITRPFEATHGEPVAWGFDAVKRLGIDLSQPPPFGDQVPIRDGEVPVFWGCGVTPQQAVIESEIPGIVIGHAPGHMLCLDVTDDYVTCRK